MGPATSFCWKIIRRHEPDSDGYIKSVHAASPLRASVQSLKQAVAWKARDGREGRRWGREEQRGRESGRLLAPISLLTVCFLPWWAGFRGHLNFLC